MESGTRFCPNHPDLKFPQFARECTVCNHPIWIHPTQAPEIIETLPEPEEKAIALKRLAEPDEPALYAGEAVKGPHGKINEKAEAKSRFKAKR